MIEFKFYFKRGMATMKQLEQTALDAQILRMQKKNQRCHSENNQKEEITQKVKIMTFIHEFCKLIVSNKLNKEKIYNKLFFN